MLTRALTLLLLLLTPIALAQEPCPPELVCTPEAPTEPTLDPAANVDSNMTLANATNESAPNTTNATEPEQTPAEQAGLSKMDLMKRNKWGALILIGVFVVFAVKRPVEGWLRKNRYTRWVFKLKPTVQTEEVKLAADYTKPVEITCEKCHHRQEATCGSCNTVLLDQNLHRLLAAHFTDPATVVDAIHRYGQQMPPGTISHALRRVDLRLGDGTWLVLQSKRYKQDDHKRLPTRGFIDFGQPQAVPAQPAPHGKKGGKQNGSKPGNGNGSTHAEEPLVAFVGPNGADQFASPEMDDHQAAEEFPGMPTFDEEPLPEEDLPSEPDWGELSPTARPPPLSPPREEREVPVQEPEDEPEWEPKRGVSARLPGFADEEPMMESHGRREKDGA